MIGEKRHCRLDCIRAPRARRRLESLRQMENAQ